MLIDLNIEPGFFHIPRKGLSHTLINRIVAKDHDLIVNLLPIFRVELAVFSVSGVLKHLLDGIFGTALYLGECVLIILRERHVEH